MIKKKRSGKLMKNFTICITVTVECKSLHKFTILGNKKVKRIPKLNVCVS